MRLFVYGYYTSRNFGDYLIAHSLLRMLRENRARDHIFIYWLDPSAPKRLQSDPQVHLVKKPGTIKELVGLLKLLIVIDVVIVGGGQKYRWSVKSGLAPQFLIPCLAKVFGKKLIFLSIGIEPIKDPLWIKLLRDLFGCSDQVSVRDVGSFLFLKSIGVKSVLSSDLVYYHILKSRNELNSLKISTNEVAVKKDIVVGVAIRCSEITEETIKHLQDLIIELAKENLVTLIPATEGDLILYRKMMKSLPSFVRKRIVVEENLEPEHLVKVVAGLDAIISTRLHFLPFSLALGIPIIGIDYPEKVKAFCKELGQVHDVHDIKSIVDAVRIDARKQYVNKYENVLRRHFNRVLKNVDLLNKVTTFEREDRPRYSILVRLKLLLWISSIALFKFVGLLPKISWRHSLKWQ